MNSVIGATSEWLTQPAFMWVVRARGQFVNGCFPQMNDLSLLNVRGQSLDRRSWPSCAVPCAYGGVVLCLGWTCFCISVLLGLKLTGMWFFCLHMQGSSIVLYNCVPLRVLPLSRAVVPVKIKNVSHHRFALTSSSKSQL